MVVHVWTVWAITCVSAWVDLRANTAKSTSMNASLALATMVQLAISTSTHTPARVHWDSLGSIAKLMMKTARKVAV